MRQEVPVGCEPETVIEFKVESAGKVITDEELVVMSPVEFVDRLSSWYLMEL